MSFSSVGLCRNVDSLYSIFLKAKTGEQIRLANEICRLAYDREVISKEWNFTIDDSNDRLYACVLSCMSAFATANANYTKAAEYTEAGLEINLQNNDLAMITDSYHKLAAIYDCLNQIEKSIFYFGKSLEIIRRTGDKEKEANTLYSMGLFYLKKTGMTWDSKTSKTHCK